VSTQSDMCEPGALRHPNRLQPRPDDVRSGPRLGTTASEYPAQLPLRSRRMRWLRSLVGALSRPEVRKVTASSSFAVADQFLFALSQLIVNLGMARSLSPSDYGAFTIAYTTFLLFGTAHTALLTEPLMVFGSSKYTSSFHRYLGLLLAGHAIVTAAFGVVLALISVLVSSAQSLSTALLYAGVSAPFLLLPWLLRRACYVRLRAHTAAFAGALYCVSMLVGLAWLAHAGLLSIRSAFLLMAGASLAASLFMMAFLRSAERPLRTPPAATAVAADHWQYGRWAMGSGFLTWLQSSIYYFALPHFTTVAEAGGLKAVMNLVLPVLHGYTALSMVLLPRLSEAGSVRVLRTRLRLALPLFLLPAGLYCAVAALYHRQVFEWLYAGQYSGISWLLPIAAPMAIAAGLATVYATALRALQRPDRVFWSYAGASGAALTVGVLFTARYHLLGAVLGLTLSYVIVAALARGYFVQAAADQREPESLA
jgi:O-antigen/teichoic acid export membrane protein